MIAKAADDSNAPKSIWVFTPSRTDPKDLEFILVQRQDMIADAVERVRESALTKHKHHLLFVGPRGCGKTHLLTLIVHRLGLDEGLQERLRIAWLNEDETSTSLLDLLMKIYAALEKRYPAEYSAEQLTQAYELKPEEAMGFVARQLLVALRQRTLLVVTENLDSLFEALGEEGQKQLRAFVQENPEFSLVASAQKLVEDLSSRVSPFFGFFQTEHLKLLNVLQATELLQNIARLQDKDDVVKFLGTLQGRSRVQAIHHLSGGNHRIYIALSQFMTRDSVDALLEPFMKMVDELTPYYQERLRWLPPLQRKIIEYLCSCEIAVPVKEVARKLFATPQTISSQLQDLREKGYVESNQRGRESLYEISEPLMRICVEVKDNQRRQPLRLLVDFLRVWYDDQELEQRLGKMDPATEACAYLKQALQRNSSEGNLRKRIMLQELQDSNPEIIAGEAGAKLLASLRNAPEWLLLVVQLVGEKKHSEAVRCLEEVIVAEKETTIRSYILVFLSALYNLLGSRDKMVQTLTELIELPGVTIEHKAKALFNRGLAHGQAGNTAAEIADYTAVIELPGAPVEPQAKALVNRGIMNGQAGNTADAIADYTAVIELPSVLVDQKAEALVNRGITYGRAGNMAAEIADYTAVIELPGAPVEQQAKALVNRGIMNGHAGHTADAIADFTALIELPDVPVEEKTDALVYRGNMYALVGNTADAIADFAVVIDSQGAVVDQVALAHYIRGVIHYGANNRMVARKDFEALTKLLGAPVNLVVDAHIFLSELSGGEGAWEACFAEVENSLNHGEKQQPAYRSSIEDLLGILFSAGLSPDGRLEKARDFVRLFHKHHALSTLGTGLVQHIGNVYRSGAPFPSADNLEGWAMAWEQAAADIPDFRLSLRLLRIGIDFLKSGGQDRGILLTLTSPERAILEQALGLTPKNGESTS